MISEAITKVEKLAVEAAVPVKVDTGDKHVTTLIIPRTGEQILFPHPSPPVASHAVTIESFALLMDRQELTPDATIYVHDKGAVCVLDDGPKDRRENRISLQLELSPVFSTIRNFAGKSLDQKTLLKLLRADLGACQFDCDLLSAVETIHWRSADDGTSTRTNAGDSMGRTVRAEVMGAKGSIPNEVEISFTPYPLENHGSVTVGCSLIVDHEEKRFILTPYPGELDLAMVAGKETIREAIGGLIDTEGVKIVLGGV